MWGGGGGEGESRPGKDGLDHLKPPLHGFVARCCLVFLS